MTTKKTIVAVLIPSYNGKRYLATCLPSLLELPYDDIEQRIYIVDNNSSDGTVEYLQERWPQARLIALRQNLGYAGGCNRGWEVIQRELPGVSYLCILNQDTEVSGQFLKPLVEFLESHTEAGSAQPKIMLSQKPDRINSLGNVIHYLGFGYSSFNERREGDDTNRRRTINYASGAAVLFRVAAVRDVGLFDDFMFMYLEDLDIGWRLLLAGWENVLVPASVVYHHYEFDRGMKQYYYFERNRLWILLKNYRVATLLLLLPALLTMELGQLAYALYRGTVSKKLRGYAYFFSVRNWRTLMRDRARTQRLRRRTDHELLERFSGIIDFQPLRNSTLERFANPLFRLYLSFVRYIIVW